MKNSFEDLRNHLFTQLERLDDEDLDLEQEVKRAKAMSLVASNIIQSRKVEVEYMKVKNKTNNFPREKQVRPIQIENGTPKQLTNFSQSDLCINHAAQNGHTKEEAENCENYSVGCPDCPFK